MKNLAQAGSDTTRIGCVSLWEHMQDFFLLPRRLLSVAFGMRPDNGDVKSDRLRAGPPRTAEHGRRGSEIRTKPETLTVRGAPVR